MLQQGLETRSGRCVVFWQTFLVNNEKFSILYFNARSLLTKISELQIYVIAVSVTWLNKTVPDSSFLRQGYVCSPRNDRAQRSGGGVLISCREDVNFFERADLQVWEESSWIEMKKSSKRGLIIGCFYRAPENHLSAIESFTTALEQSLSPVDLTKNHVSSTPKTQKEPKCDKSKEKKRNMVTHLIRKGERAHNTSLHWQAIMNPCSTTTKNFWKHKEVVQGEIKLDVVPDLINSTDGTTVYCAPEKAELLGNSFFSK